MSYKKRSESACQMSQTRLSTGYVDLNASPSKKKYKASATYTHYSWLTVEWLGAHGLPLEMIEALSHKLVGPGIDADVYAKKFAKGQHNEPFSMQSTGDSDSSGLPKSFDRKGSTWPPTAVIEDFLLDCEV